MYGLLQAQLQIVGWLNRLFQEKKRPILPVQSTVVSSCRLRTQRKPTKFKSQTAEAESKWSFLGMMESMSKDPWEARRHVASIPKNTVNKNDSMTKKKYYRSNQLPEQYLSYIESTSFPTYKAD
jgi:hypothetical protein